MVKVRGFVYNAGASEGYETYPLTFTGMELVIPPGVFPILDPLVSVSKALFIEGFV